jgi:cytochrome b
MRHHHELSTQLLAALLVVHIAATLLQHYACKNTVRGRM